MLARMVPESEVAPNGFVVAAGLCTLTRDRLPSTVRSAPPPEPTGMDATKDECMRLYSGRIQTVAAEIVKALLKAGDIEAQSPREVEADIAAVLTGYLEAERDVTERAKDLLQARGLAQTELARTRKLIADQRGIKLGDEALDYVLDQIVEMLMHSQNVDEVYAEDVELRRKARAVLAKEEQVGEDLEREARSRMKHVQEGTRTWEVEYRRVMEDIRRRRGL